MIEKPRTCGGGCCSSTAADKPVFESEESSPALPMSTSRGSRSDDTKDACPAMEFQPMATPNHDDRLVVQKPEKSGCRATCCSGKIDDGEKVPPKPMQTAPILPVRGPSVNYDSSASPGPSSCQATICDDDKCGHDLAPKQEPNDYPALGRRQLVFGIQGMDCPGCSPRVVRALVEFPSVADCHVDVFAGRATVTYHPDRANPDDMARRVVAMTGFQCHVEDDQVLGIKMRRMNVQLGRPLGDDGLLKLEGVNVLEEKASGRIELEYERGMNPRDVLALFAPWDGVYVPPSNESSVDSAQKEVVRLLYLTLFSAVLTLPVLVLAWAPLPPRPTAYGAVSLAMTTVIQVVVARPIYVSGIRTLLFQYTIDMDLLVSLSMGTAYVFSTVAYACTVAGKPIQDGESYFETAALLVTLVMLGRLIAAYARRRSTNAVSRLGSMQASKATLVETSNGQVTTRTIPVELLHVGDIVRIAPGELIPTDGKIIRGEGLVDESAITGESVPVLKSPATAQVLMMCGTTLVSIPAEPLHIDMRVTVAPDANTVARMAELMQGAQSARLRVQDKTDRAAGWLAPAALTIAIVAFVGWTGVGVRHAYKLDGHERSGQIQKAVVDAIGYAVAILVVSCPCALALCVPMVAVIAVAVGTRRGSIEALEDACDVKVVVFDKTGTLTQGKLGIETATYYCQSNHIPWVGSEQEIQQLVYELTEASTHPVAVATHGSLSATCTLTGSPLIKSSDVRSVPGKGLEVALGGYVIRGGNAAWAAGGGTFSSSLKDNTVFMVSISPNTPHPEFTTIAYYTLSDSLRPDSIKTIRQLTARGIDVHILSGDAPGVVSRTAAALGIPDAQARGGCLPEEKAQWVKFFQTGGMNDGGECGTSDSDIKCCSSVDVPNTTIHNHDHDHDHGHDNHAHTRKRPSTDMKRRKVMFVGDGTNDALALVQSDISVSLGTGTDIASNSATVVLLSPLSTGLTTLFALARASRRRVRTNMAWALVYNVVAVLFASGVLGRGMRIPPQWAGLGELVSVLPVVLVAWSLGLVRW
ncbi:copper-transporting ATPase [Rhizoctonia solani AG-1 IA]|uniref:Copper-transporting ATPase n=1 Tax=Thanatephorus cucumeris (strain AG1-IA) TaxID=983506 RepID=L8WRQ0_THACA|nr:copper-transporting ATPase [Rhizoctonia solani AG-1 IA]